MCNTLRLQDSPPFDPRLMLGLHLVDLFLSLLTVLFWIVKSYKRHIDKAFIGAEFLFAIFFAAFYLLGLLRARLRPWAAFSPASLANIVTFVPLFLQATGLRTWLNFSYGRSLCALWAFEALEAAGAVDNLSDVRRRLVLFVLRFVALVISFAGTMYVFEVLGDPGGISDSFVHAEMGEISVYQMCYFVFITVSTVGYGDFTPRTLLGRAFTVLIILSGVAFFSVETSELLALSSSEASGKGRFHPKRRQSGHVLVMGGALGHQAGPTGTLADFLRELCTPRPGVVPPEVVLLVPGEPSEQLRALLRASWAKSHVTLLVASPLEARDLSRCRADSAVAAFVLAELACPESDRAREDEAAVLAAAALHRAHPSLRLRLLLCEQRALLLAAQAGLPGGGCVTAADVAPRLVGLAARMGGASTLVANLLRTAPSPRAGMPGGGARGPGTQSAWVGEYSHGAGRGVFGATLGPWAQDLGFHAAAAKLHASHGVTLLAVQRRGRLVLAPPPGQGGLLVAGDVAFVVAHDAATVAHALQSPRGTDWRALFHARREEAARQEEARARELRVHRRTAALAQALAQAQQQEPEGMAAQAQQPQPEPAPRVDAAVAATAAYLPIQFRTRVALSGRQRSLAHVTAAGGHTVLVLLSASTDAWGDAEQVLHCLRAPHLPCPLPTVVLAPSQPPSGWAQALGGCPVVVGSPSQAAALHACGCGVSAAVVVMAGEPASGSSPALVDRAAVLASTVLERAGLAVWGRDLVVVTELHAPASLAYLPQRLPPAGDAADAPAFLSESSRQLESAAQRAGASVPPGLHARFACGRATFRTDVGRLLGAELVTPGLVDLFRAFVDPMAQGCDSSALWRVPLVSLAQAGSPAPRTYGALFSACCAQGVLPLGLWRMPRGAADMAPPHGHGAPPGGYVVTAPPHWLPLRARDAAFVLASPEWGRLHSRDFDVLRRCDAAIVLQTRWRIRQAHRMRAKLSSHG